MVKLTVVPVMPLALSQAVKTATFATSALGRTSARLTRDCVAGRLRHSKGMTSPGHQVHRSLQSRDREVSGRPVFEKNLNCSCLGR
jgi:hypothetical protein